MTEAAAASAGGHVPPMTQADEMSLADSMAAVTDESVPDTLEVRSDAVAVMHNEMAPMQRPLRIAAAAVGLAVVVIVVGGLLGRLMRGKAGSTTP